MVDTIPPSPTEQARRNLALRDAGRTALAVLAVLTGPLVVFGDFVQHSDQYAIVGAAFGDQEHLGQFIDWSQNAVLLAAVLIVAVFAHWWWRARAAWKAQNRISPLTPWVRLRRHASVLLAALGPPFAAFMGMRAYFAYDDLGSNLLEWFLLWSVVVLTLLTAGLLITMLVSLARLVVSRPVDRPPARTLPRPSIVEYLAWAVGATALTLPLLSGAVGLGPGTATSYHVDTPGTAVRIVLAAVGIAAATTAIIIGTLRDRRLGSDLPKGAE